MADDLSVEAACDFAEAIANKQVRPFERIAEVLVVARKAERLAVEAEARRAQADADVLRVQTELLQLQNTERAAFTEYKAANDQERRRLGALLVEQNNQVTQRLAELDAIKEKAIREHGEFLAKLEAERAEKTAATLAATAQAREDLATAQQEYEAFKTKVGLK
jgi:hypothetical protein